MITMVKREQKAEQDRLPYTEPPREHQVDAAQFAMVMTHFYRAEVTRSNTWRTRLDTTTNWAVATVGAMLTFVFGAPQNPHFMLLLTFLLGLAFLFFETRRYRYYALWAYRVRLMETDFLAPMLTPPFHPSADWINQLIASLVEPTFPISWIEAFGRRLSRHYIWLFSLVLISWGTKLAIHPRSTSDIIILLERASIGPLDGRWIVAGVSVIYIAMCGMLLLSYLSPAWRVAKARLVRWFERWTVEEKRAPRLSPRYKEQLATIVSTEGQAVSAQIIEELGRGVTILQGIGAYTGQRRDVLLCAVAREQIPHLQRIVSGVDSQAMVVVSPVQDVRGGGFRPFEPPS
jgi:uncharacterized membrane protein